MLSARAGPGQNVHGPRFAAIESSQPVERLRGSALADDCHGGSTRLRPCAARGRSSEPQGAPADHSLEPLLPGFLCASAAMSRVVEQIHRLQGNELTVLITGESGTGKELIARFDPRRFSLQRRDVSAVQLHDDWPGTGRQPAFRTRRGSFTGAVADQPGLVRCAGRRNAVPG